MPRDFEGNRRLQTFSVVIYDDDVPEGVEELNITLSLQDPSLANRVTVSPAVATVRIDDGKFDCFNYYTKTHYLQRNTNMVSS